MNSLPSESVLKLLKAGGKGVQRRRDDNKTREEHEAARIALQEMRLNLGEGPMRFAPSQPERSTREQLQTLPLKQFQVYVELKGKWERKFPEQKEEMCDDMILRFARNTKQPFDGKSAWQKMKQFNARYLFLSLPSLEKQLLSKTIFPLPVLRTRDGHKVLYMKPSRYNPKSSTETNDVIESLVYCINDMLEREKNATRGIACIALMNDWTRKHFERDFFFQVMQTLQGNRIPVRVRLFLIVNPPAWFGTIWRTVLKRMVAPGLQVKIIKQSELGNYLPRGYLDYMPDDLEGGQVPTEELVEDWVAYRRYVEGGGGTTVVTKKEDNKSDTESLNGGGSVASLKSCLKPASTIGRRRSTGFDETSYKSSSLGGSHSNLGTSGSSHSKEHRSLRSILKSQEDESRRRSTGFNYEHRHQDESITSASGDDLLYSPRSVPKAPGVRRTVSSGGAIGGSSSFGGSGQSASNRRLDDDASASGYHEQQQKTALDVSRTESLEGSMRSYRSGSHASRR